MCVCVYIILKCKTEIGKRNPFNAGIKLRMQLDLDINLFTNFRLYVKIINEKYNQIYLNWFINVT